MAAPFRPSEIAPLLPSADDSYCTIFKKLLQLSYKVYLFYRWAVDEDTGGIKKGANSLGQMICELNCDT